MVSAASAGAPVPSRTVPLSAVVFVLVGSFVAELTLVAYVAQIEHATTAASGFPIAITSDALTPKTFAFGLVSLVMAAVVATQSLALFLLYRTVARGELSRLEWATLATGVACFAIASTLAPALTSGDLYSYVGYATLGWQSYAPPRELFAGPLHAINVWWSGPMPASAYGPLWLVYAKVVANFGHSLYAKIEAFRIAGVFWLLLLVAAMRSGRASKPVLVLVLLNPMLWFEFVANGHNDLIGVAFVAIAGVFGTTLFLPVLMCIVAGLFKAPLALCGLVALNRLPVKVRVIASLAVLLATGALSVGFGGSAYIHSILSQARQHSVALMPGHIALQLLELSAFLVAIVFSRYSILGALGAPVLGAGLFPWYFIWGLPYAVVGRLAVPFLLALPTVGFFLTSAFDSTPITLGLAVALGTLVVQARVRRSDSWLGTVGRYLRESPS